MAIHHSVGRGAPPPQRNRFRGSLLLAAATLYGCTDGVTAPPPADVGASVRWNAIARELVISDRTAPPIASRAYAYLSVAQYAAALAAHGLRPGVVPSLATLRGISVPASAAIPTASARLLAAMFPAHAIRIERELQADLTALRGKSVELAAIERGAAMGTAIAESFLLRAAADGWDAAWTGTMPNGPGYWAGTGPQLPMWGHVRSWLWASGSELRAPPPPAFDSPELREALAEVRRISESRTPAQLEIARFWADGPGTYTPPGHWNAIAAELIGTSGMGELHAARTLALMNVAIADAVIGCWDTKYTYWLTRPYQADLTISTPIGQPPHPSYPSGHACSSGAAAEVLAAFFPNEADTLERMAVEACDSRVYAGIHYRFDAEAGMTIGTRAAERALALGDELVRSEIARAFEARVGN